MVNEKETIIKALENYRGDNLYRAKAAFKNYTEERLNSEYGESGKTPNEILAGYEKHEANIDAALTWIKEIK